MNAPATIPSKPLENSEKTLAELRGAVAQLQTDGLGEEAFELLFDVIAGLVDKNNLQALRIMRLLKEKFGRKSEKMDPRQWALFLQSVQEHKADTDQDSEADKALKEEVEGLKKELKAKQKRLRGGGRITLPTNLPIEKVFLPVPDKARTCTSCGQKKTPIGLQRSRVLEFIPASFKIIEYERESLACRNCDESEAVTAPAANKPIEKGLPGPGLLAHVGVSKFNDHIPLNHLSQMYKRYGVKLSPSTLGRWVEMLADELTPLYQLLCVMVLNAYVLGADDTGLKVLDKKKSNNIKRGHLWAYVGYERGSPEAVVFDRGGVPLYADVGREVSPTISE